MSLCAAACHSGQTEIGVFLVCHHGASHALTYLMRARFWPYLFVFMLSGSIYTCAINPQPEPPGSNATATPEGGGGGSGETDIDAAPHFGGSGGASIGGTGGLLIPKRLSK